MNPEINIPQETPTAPQTQPTQFAPSAGMPTPPTKKKFFTKKVIVILSIIVVLAGAASAYFFVFNDGTKNKTVNNESPDQSTENATAKNLVSTTFKDAKFIVPDNWSLVSKTLSESDSLNMFSPEATPTGDGYMSISAGLGIAVRIDARDPAAEAGKAKPIDAYISNIGAPKIEEAGVEFYEQKIDYSKFVYTTNAKGVEMMAYPWGYEGCYESVVFLGSKSVFYMSIEKAPECADNQILQNPDIKTIVDSVEFVDGENKIESEVFAKSNYEKELNEFEVHASNIAFAFNDSYDSSLGSGIMSGGTIIPKLKADDTFDKILMGPTVEDMIQSYKCSGCGFTIQAYGTVLTLNNEADTSDYQKVSDTVYGKVQQTTAAQKDGVANSYSYVKILDENTKMVVTFVVERSGNNKEDNLPALDNQKILNTINSIVLIPS